MVMNQWPFNFDKRIDYSRYDEITVEIALAVGNIVTAVDAKLDTGSKFCLFQPRYARLLRLDLEGGIVQRIRTATGSFLAYGHEITLQVGDLQWEAIIYFAESEEFPINVVGRVGFLDHLQLGLVDYEQALYLSPYQVS
jgi:hypothetical protein